MKSNRTDNRRTTSFGRMMLWVLVIVLLVLVMISLGYMVDIIME